MKKTAKRVISAALALLTVLSSIALAPGRVLAAGESFKLRFDSVAKLSQLTNPHNLSVSYSEGENAVQAAVTGDGGDPYVLLNLEASDISADAYKYVVLTYRTPVTNSSKAAKSELFMSAGSITSPTANYSVTFTPVNGYKYRTQIVDMSSQSYWTGRVHSIRLDVFSEGSPWDAFYLYSVSFCTGASAATAAASEESAAANGFLEEIPEGLLASDSYNFSTYAETKFWRGEIVYNESVYPLQNPDGTMPAIPLMYDAERVISVRDGTLGTEYKYGTDYTVSDGKLIILTTGNIPTIKYTSYKVASKPADTSTWQPCRDGGYTFFSEGSLFHRAQLAVTYTHKDSWAGPIPESKAQLLPKTFSKLQNREKLTVVFNGDSITYGANASGLPSVNVAPHMPLWTDMTIAGLKKAYGYTDINSVNTAVGGMNSAWGAANANENISKYNPDLVFISFGQNDAPQGVTPEQFEANIKSIISTVRAKNPECEFVLVANMRSNPDTYFETHQASFLPVLKSLEEEGIAVADVTSIHTYLMGIKTFADMTGNNVNHPNDFLIRFYAQIMLTALTPSKLELTKSEAVSALKAYASPDLYLEAERAELEEKIASGTAAINACESEGAVAAALAEAKAAIDKIKTAAEYEAERLDYTHLVFNSSAALTTISASNHVSLSLDYSSDSTAVTVKGDDPWIRISYPAGKASADKYKYAAIIYKIPSAAASSAAQVFLTAGKQTWETPDASKSFTPAKGSFYYQVLDMSADSYWNGDIHGIRIDPFISASDGDSMYIHSICLFETQKEAQSYASKTAGSLSGSYIGNNLYRYFDSETKAAEISPEGKILQIGDVNGDGKITVLDSTLLRRCLSGILDAFAFHTDINGDGRVTIKDSLLLRKIIANIETSSGTYSTFYADCAYDSAKKSADVRVLGGGVPSVRINLADKKADGESFTRVTLTYLASDTFFSRASLRIVTDSGKSDCKYFDISPSTEYQGVTLDFSDSAAGGKIKYAVLSLGDGAKEGDEIYISGVILSDTEKAASRALSSAVAAANRQAGIVSLPAGREEIPFNGASTAAAYSYYTSVSEGKYAYSSRLSLDFDRQPEEPFDRFTLTYTSSTLARGVITYAVDGMAVEDEFYLEASSSPSTFSSLIQGYFSSSAATEILSLTVYPVCAASSAFSITALETQDYENYSGTLYLENDKVKAGILLDMGGGISHYEKKDDGRDEYSNLLNSYDVGRLIQQSYYGIDKAPYVLGNMGGTPWRYNPVQGGDIANNPSRIVDVSVSSSSIYVKVRPMDWGHDGHITPSYMENLYTLYDSFVKVDNRFVDFSGYTHTRASQELPAFYTVSALKVFSMYNGSSPWTGAAYSSYPDLQFWAGNSSQNFALKDTSEYWYAFTDTSGFGVGLYVPGVTNVLAGRHVPDVQSTDPKANPTCYFAPLRQLTLKSGKPLTYSYLICAGNIASIRETFKANRGLINNSSLAGY